MPDVSRPNVVPLDPTDPTVADEIRAVMAAAYATEAAILGVDDFPPLHRTATQIAASGGRFLGVRVRATLAAVLEVEEPKRGRVHLGALVVLPAQVRRGLASALLRHVLDAHPADEITVSTGERNVPALRAYAKQGFVEQRSWTTGDGIPMRTMRWVGPDHRGRSPRLTMESYLEAVERLAAADPVLAGVAQRWGPPPFWRHPAGFAGLVHGILAQQVSLESAVAAYGRLEGALGRVEPEAVLTLDDARLRAIGFSRQKVAYARGLAAAIVAGALDLARLEAAPDDEVRRELLALRGIGPWTADVYLLFALRRPDAWPSGDLALAKAVEELWGLPVRPGWDELDAWAERWRPLRAVAARFLWHDYLARRGRVWAG